MLYSTVSDIPTDSTSNAPVLTTNDEPSFSFADCLEIGLNVAFFKVQLVLNLKHLNLSWIMQLFLQLLQLLLFLVAFALFFN